MTAAEFKKKWSRYQGKETSAYQGHFDDLCRLLGQPTPAEADPSGNDFFCYQKRVIKDLELFELHDTPDAGDPEERGFADVWKKGCFGWEYKGKKKNLDEAYRQLLRYREALLNPPLLVVCDFERYIIRTNFNGTVQETFEFSNDQIDRPENWRVLRALFENPDLLKPQRTTNEVTKALAEKFAEVARSLQKRESAELADARTRAEVTVAQRKNLRIARFLNRLIFCFFAEDTGLLPKNLFSDIAKIALEDPHQFSQALESLFRTMARGGMFGQHKIRHFNGHLFEDTTVFELNDDERRILVEAAEADWQFVEPSIMGTLFARGLDPDQRAALGAQYTDRGDIVTLVEPVLMAPLRREWAVLKASLLPALRRGNGTPANRARLEAFLKKLRKLIIMDPACGSGNFLYISLQMLLDLEKEVNTFATQLGFQFKPEVGVHQLRAFEINPYAYELAQVTVQIGYLQWLRDNGFLLDRTPVLQTLDGFHNEDALLVPHYHSKAKTLKEAQAGEHMEDDSLRFYTEREWPECDVVVGNPPFLGGKLLRRELGDSYVNALFETYGKQVRHEADLCCYWLNKARQLIVAKRCKRAGLLATQGIRGGANREVLNEIKRSGDIFFAESDRDWVLEGANVHVSMIGFDNGSERSRTLDGRPVAVIHSNLTAATDVTTAKALRANLGVSFMGTTKGGAFDISIELALELLRAPNPHGKPNSDVVVPWVNGMDLAQRPSGTWIIDFGLSLTESEAAKYEATYEFTRAHIKPQRDRSRTTIKEWWLHERRRGEMRVALAPLARFLCTIRVSKHRLFVWLTAPTLPDSATFAFARDDDYFFGLLHSRLHEVWARRQGTQVRERESGFRYTPTTCFETFPFPFQDDLQTPEPTPGKPPVRKQPEPDRTYAEMLAAKHYYMGKEEPTPYRAGGGRQAQSSASWDSQDLAAPALSKEEHRAAIGTAAKELNELRERWLNPPEWTVQKILEFPGSANGPWSRYVVNPDKEGIGTVRYPRLEPRDAECAAKLRKRTLTNLYNERPAWLDLAHKKLDAAVAAAYGWPADLTDDQILEKLLALNLERAAEEEQAATAKPTRASRQKRQDELV
jgi:type II restriction/modification system DNA methylase subunit YeeA